MVNTSTNTYAYTQTHRYINIYVHICRYNGVETNMLLGFVDETEVDFVTIAVRVERLYNINK